VEVEILANAIIKLDLLVLYVANINASVMFYEAIGLQFVREQHGSGSEHWAAICNGKTVFELYPASQKNPVSRVRLGFEVQSIADVVDAIGHTAGSIQTIPQSGKCRATCIDPDGNKVDLVESSSTFSGLS
jgi:catechol 2,3-dioxygenase-like lactoylglutathione lyase family enzyme